MKFLHLSDLHIGKRICNVSMLEDQAYILKQIVRIAREEKPDAVLLAGDIYDKPTPGAEAVQLFDTFLTALSKTCRAVFLISGNHDSPERLAFGARLLEHCGVYLSPVYDGTAKKVTLEDEWGKVNVYLLPFLKPALVRHVLKQEQLRKEAALAEAAGAQEREAAADEEGRQETAVREPGEAAEAAREIVSYEDAVRAAVERMEVDVSQRNVLVAHQFVTGATRSESEEFSIGGLDNVDGAVFDSFDYVALGHIHRAQKVGRETMRYCGTPLCYSFSEAGWEKTVTVVELREKGRALIRTVPLAPRRRMRKIRGAYLEVTSRDFYRDTDVEDYLHVTLTDEEDIPGAFEKLRSIYPNLMQLEYDNVRTQERKLASGLEELEKKSELEIFEEFYLLQNDRNMSGQQRAYMEALILQTKEEEGGR